MYYVRHVAEILASLLGCLYQKGCQTASYLLIHEERGGGNCEIASIVGVLIQERNPLSAQIRVADSKLRARICEMLLKHPAIVVVTDMNVLSNVRLVENDEPLNVDKYSHHIFTQFVGDYNQVS